MPGLGKGQGTIFSNNNNLNLLRKSAHHHQNKKRSLFEFEKRASKVTTTTKSNVSLKELKDIHMARAENLKYTIFLVVLIPWGLFVMWMMGLIW